MGLFLKLAILVVYALLLNRVCELLQFGGVRSRLPIIVFFFILLLILAGSSFFISRQKKKQVSRKGRVFRYGYIIIAGVLTVNASYRIYQSGTNYGGELAWFLERWFHQKEIALEHSNLYETGITGIIEDIEKRMDLPEELYLGDSFSLSFNPDGEITKVDFSMYGKNDQNETKGFLVVYDKQTSNKMTIYKEVNLNGSYEETKQLAILQDTINAVFLNRPFQAWSELKKPYVLTYHGERDWGYNPAGIIYINAEQEEQKAAHPYAKIVGCTLSVTFEGYSEVNFPEEKYIPHRYLLVDDIKSIPWEDPNSQLVMEAEKQRQKEMTEARSASEAYLDTEIGYRLYEVDAALGSRLYSLQKTVNGGEEWTVVNPDPFGGSTGMGAELQFLDEDLGFLYLSHSGGANGEVYITRDGGTTVTLISLELPQIDLGGGTVSEVYDTPKNVIEEENELILEIGQGADGDYNGGDSIYFYSDDQGETWRQK